MISSLNCEKQKNLKAKFVIVGGGTVGLVIAQKLASLKIGTVIVLETGGEQISTASEMFPAVVFTRSIYQGAEAGRFAGLGGTSARWGGAMIPFLPTDFEGDFQDLINNAGSYIAETEKIFSLPKGPYIDSHSIEIPNYVTRKAKWPKFSKRNVAHLLARKIKHSTNLTVYLHAKVVSFEGDKSEIISVVAENENGSRFLINCEKVIITAGAIESTRMLLEIEEKFKESAELRNESTTGFFFSDHLSVKIAHIKPKERNKLNTLVGYRFSKGGSMSNIRFELQTNSELRKSLPPHFVHISFDLSTPGGFSILREILRELQEGKVPSIRLFVELLRFIPWMLRAAWWRFVKHRLLYPENAEIEMHLVFEQFPNFDNRIRLKDENFRKINGPSIEISWGVSSQDKINLVKILEQFKSSWGKSQIRNYAETVFLDDGEILNNLVKGGGIFHPTGSTRIKFNDFSGSVDTDLKVIGFKNLFLLSTSVLNSGGSANPTMTEMMLGLRLVDYLASQLNKLDKN